MRVVIQRVASASVEINSAPAAEIGKGLLLLLGIEHNDDTKDVEWLCQKIVNMRIFNDSAGKMNLSLTEAEGSCLLVSQFTLHASTKKGNRPSFIKAALPEQAIHLYNAFIEQLEKTSGNKIQTGTFGADMKVYLVNDGPVTILLDSKNKE